MMISNRPPRGKNPYTATLSEQNLAVRNLHKKIDTLKQELGDKLKAVKTYIFWQEADFKLSEGKPHEEIKADIYDFNELYYLLKTESIPKRKLLHSIKFDDATGILTVKIGFARVLKIL